MTRPEAIFSHISKSQPELGTIFSRLWGEPVELSELLRSRFLGETTIIHLQNLTVSFEQTFEKICWDRRVSPFCRWQRPRTTFAAKLFERLQGGGKGIITRTQGSQGRREITRISLKLHRGLSMISQKSWDRIDGKGENPLGIFQ